MNLTRIILSGIIALFSLNTMAQSTVNTADAEYNKAQALYDNGEFDECEKEAKRFVSNKKDMIKTSTYKLLALCRLAEDDLDGARDYVAKLLKYDPYFTASFGDPQRFIDLINENKNQEAGITTASRQAESIEEAPVPVTLITDEMIRHSGCNTLQELLCLYVPGMTLAEGAESNIAMHGIYSLMQDKILIMVDGHRLNSSSTNAEAPDFRTSLDKVQQIEVLRGPASSLYGNVALTAVVNIITRKGAVMNGGRISALAGTQNTYSGSIVVGGGNNVVDLMGWGSIYTSDGFKSYGDNGNGNVTTLYAHGYKDRPSYDIGMKGRWKDFTMSFNMQRSKQTPYFNTMQLSAESFAPDYNLLMENPIDYAEYAKQVAQMTPCFDAYRNFNYDSYESINGNKPGVTRSDIRINLDYAHSFDNFDIQASGYINFESTAMYNVLGDSINKNVATWMLVGLTAMSSSSDDAQTTHFNNIIQQLIDNRQTFTKGAFQNMDWSGVTYGLQAQALTKYRFLGNGTLILGSQFELFSLSNSNFVMGGKYTASGALDYSDILHEGRESSISGYLQVKHFFTPRFIANVGLRYDHKSRFNNANIDKVSPRFSLIYKLSNRLSLRGNYNYSLVDAPYIYRACIVGLFNGGADLKPETMHGFNVGTTYNNKEKHFIAEMGAFYNILYDLVVERLEKKSLKGGIFYNAGKVRTLGLEGSVQYTKPRFFTNVNATWQRIITSNNYIDYNSQTFSTPEFHVNAIIAAAPYNGTGTGFFNGGKIWLRCKAQFQTATYYKNTDVFYCLIATQENAIMTVRVKPQCIVGLGATYEWKHIDVDLSLKNLFNNQYKVGSMLSDGVPYAGRQFLAKLTYKF